MEMVSPTVIGPLQLGPKARIELRKVRLERRGAWAWLVRADNGRLAGFGIKPTRAMALERAVEEFPQARAPVLEQAR